MLLLYTFSTNKEKKQVRKNMQKANWSNAYKVWMCIHWPTIVIFFRFSVFPNGTLKIANVTKQDGGIYTCIARNQFGSASTAGRLLITGESLPNVMLFTQSSQVFKFVI